MANKKIAIAAAIVGLVGTVAWGKHVWTGTPRYSLGQLQQAIEEKDADKIEEYLDTESIATQIVDVSLASAQQQAVEQNDIFGMLGGSLGLVEMIRPQMQSPIEGFIAEGLQAFSPQSLEDIKLDSIERNQESATVTFDLSQLPEEEGMPIKSIAMNLKQQSDRQWQITGFSKDSLQAVADFIEE